MKKKWNLLRPDKEAVKNLKESLNVHPIICGILVNRGIREYDTARTFFRPELKDLHDPWLLKDMDKATERITRAMSENEKILVYGDYDVDGTTAVACMYRFLRDIHPVELLDFYIPHRYREGYGISKIAIDHAFEKGFSLIISLDCGIKSVELISYAKGLGIDFIVCDHHLPDEQLPDAYAILNPKQPGCHYPFKELCGCGVGFKLISALSSKLAIDGLNPARYLDLQATAIAADIVSMTGENRILAYYGLKKINSDPSPGIAALMKKTGIEKVKSISDVVFMIAPRVNAAGRMDDASKAVRLFIEEEMEKADDFASILHNDNIDRKEADTRTTEEALAIIKADDEMMSRKSSVIYNENWSKGIVGIVASRLIEHFYRPTIVLTRSGDLATGSARSVPGFNLYEAVHACREYLVAYGGHYAAAGLSLLPENVDAFRQKFEEVVSAGVNEDLLTPAIDIDCEITIEEIRKPLFNIIRQMEPFGPDNAEPTFVIRGVKDTGGSKVVKEKHLRFEISQGSHRINGIGFGLANLYPLLESKDPVDIVCRINENEFRGNSNLELRVLDMRKSETIL
jgi:single-stranded-DNA-specific exonuclease